MVKAVITLMCRLLSNLRRGKRPRPSTGLPLVLNVNRMQGWFRYWAAVLQRMKEDPGQVTVAVADNWELSLLRSCPVFIWCSVFTAANLFNLGDEADEVMRIERCWMKPPGHYWRQPSHTLLMQGHQIDSLDACSCMLLHAPARPQQVRNVYLATFVCPLLLKLLVRGLALICVVCMWILAPWTKPTDLSCDSNLVKQEPNKYLLIVFSIRRLSVSVCLFMSPVSPRLCLRITMAEFLTTAWWFHYQHPWITSFSQSSALH